MSNYSDLSFSDEEVITLYLIGIIDKNKEINHYGLKPIVFIAAESRVFG
jgi:hypothetical protein